MSPGDRRLAALAALFAPARALAILTRVGGPGGARGVAHATRLVSASRRERLAALASAIAVDAGAALARAEASAALERPRVAAILRAAASGAPARGASAPLLRLCRERTGR